MSCQCTEINLCKGREKREIFPQHTASYRIQGGRGKWVPISKLFYDRKQSETLKMEIRIQSIFFPKSTKRPNATESGFRPATLLDVLHLNIRAYRFLQVFINVSPETELA